MDLNYVVITPVRDEEENIEKTIRSMISQSVKPKIWIIIDDGSTDRTVNIVERYTKTFDWIKLIRRNDRGYRDSAGGEVSAFYSGYDLLNDDYEYIVKLDGDVSFSSNYFEKCISKFKHNSHLGIGGGSVRVLKDGDMKLEAKYDPVFHVRGATKIYSKKCWDDINGIKNIPGWDTIDELKAQMLGWETQTFPDIKIVHHRPTGKVYGAWKNWIKNGTANYFTGYHPLFMIFKCTRRLIRKPFLIQGLGLFIGYFSSLILNKKQHEDIALQKYIRKEQLNRLFFKKTIWKY
jgi:glycosyltransferase involved in cell wall biosynthesis